MRSRGEVFILDTVHPVLLQGLKKMGYIVREAYSQSTDELKASMHDAVGLVVRSRLPIDQGLLEKAQSLRFIARVGSGMENIDVDYARSEGVACLNSPEGNRDAVGEHALGLLLGLVNHIPKGDAEVRKGMWKREENRGNEVGNMTVAIIGYGNTGSAFAQRLSGFGARVIAYDKFKKGFGTGLVEEVDMQEVFREADVLSLHVPLNDETRYMVNTSYLGKFVRPIWLINTSRGAVVHTADLAEALHQGKLRGAGLDVLEYEKKSFEQLDIEDFPQAFRRLAGMSNVILSPHVAGWTMESKTRLATILLDKIRALDLPYRS